MGRPSEFTRDQAAEFCARISEGRGHREVRQAEEMPSARTIFNWLARFKDFQVMYSAALMLRAHDLAEEGLAIIDDSSADYRVDEDGTHLVLDHEHIARSKARADYRKWLAGRFAPQVYGDRCSVDHGGSISIRHEDALKQLA